MPVLPDGGRSNGRDDDDDGVLLADALASQETRSLIDVLPTALLGMDARGRVIVANDAARERLQFRNELLDLVAVTRVGATRHDGRGQFLLTVGRVPRLRFNARDVEWRTSASTSVRLLVVDEAETPNAAEPAQLRARISLQLDAVERAADLVGPALDDADPSSRAHAVDGLRRRLRDLRLMIDAPSADGPTDPTRLPAIPVRELVAEIVRRARRHYAGLAARPFTIEDHLRDESRAVRAHPVSLTQAVLTLVHLLTLDAPGARATVRAAIVGCRLRITVTAPAEHAGALPELRRRRPLLQTLVPILAAHDATLEMSRDPRGRPSARLHLATVPSIGR